MSNSRRLSTEESKGELLVYRSKGGQIKLEVRLENEFYNLDMIISVGYRVKSLIAARFRNSDYFKHLFESGLLNRELRKIAQIGASDHGLIPESCMKIDEKFE